MRWRRCWTKSSVVAAARRMHLSAPAMSRTLARIRETTGDPIFVQSGRQLVPTPRARASCTSRSGCAQGAADCWRRGAGGPGTAGRALQRARQRHLHWHPCGPPAGRDAAGHAARHAVLRAGRGRPGRRCVAQRPRDLFISASRPLGHEIRVQPLFSIRVVGVAREDHPLFRTRSRRAAWRAGAISASRAGARPRGRSTRWPAWAWTGMWRWSCPPPAARCWRCKAPT